MIAAISLLWRINRIQPIPKYSLSAAPFKRFTMASNEFFSCAQGLVVISTIENDRWKTGISGCCSPCPMAVLPVRRCCLNHSTNAYSSFSSSGMSSAKCTFLNCDGPLLFPCFGNLRTPTDSSLSNWMAFARRSLSQDRPKIPAGSPMFPVRARDKMATVRKEPLAPALKAS